MLVTAKSQLSVEFLIILFFAILLFSFSFYIYSEKQNDVAYAEELFIAKDIVHKFSDNINFAYLDSSTCGDTFYVPTTLNSVDYNLSFLDTSHMISLDWDSGYYSFPILTSNVSVNTEVKSSYYVNCTGGISIE